MDTTPRHGVWGLVPEIFADTSLLDVATHWCGGLAEELLGEVSDQFLELLLKGMEVTFCLSGDYRKNIQSFEGRYQFTSADGLIAAATTFSDGKMEVHDQEIDDWDVKVTFRTAAAFRDFIFSKNQDILDSVLRNDVDIAGNPTYIYRFGYLARDLVGRLGGG